MPITQAVVFVVVFALLSSIYASKIDKKSGIYAHHHVDKCEDYKAVSSKCHMWKDLGFCFKHRKEMEFVCSKTCKFCDPSESHWSYSTKPDENAKAKTIIETPHKISPVVEVMGKKKALYLSSNDIAGMLQTLSSKDYGATEKPTPKPKEVAVIQGRIQKVEPVVIKTDGKGQAKLSKPQVSVGGKLQNPPKIPEKEDSNGAGKSKNDVKAEDKNKEGQNKDNSVENQLLRMMNQIIRGSPEEKLQRKPEDKASEKKPEPMNIQDIMNLFQKLKENLKQDQENPAKENQATEQKLPKAAANTAEQNGDNNTADSQMLNAKTKALLAAIKLFKAVSPVHSTVKGNHSTLMEQLAAAAEEASVALKLMNKTGAADKLKEANLSSGEGNVMYNVKLLQEELNKYNKNQSNVVPSSPDLEANATANTSKIAADNVSTTNPQLNEFILRLQDTLRNPQGKDLGLSSSLNERGGVASRKDEGKPTLSEIIPFNIKVDDMEPETTGNSKSETANEQTYKQDQKSTFQNDEEKIMKILDGLDQNDKKAKDKGSSEKDIVIEIREAYDDLGEIINGLEIKDGIKKKKNKDDKEDEEDEDTEGEKEDNSEEKKKQKKKEDENDSKDEKESKEKDGDKEKEKKNKKNGDHDDDDDDDDNGGYYEDAEFYDPAEKPKTKKKKSLSKQQHLEKVLSLIKKAGHHLEMIGGKRVKTARKNKPSDEDTFTRSSQTSQADWKTLATRLARQLGLVLKKMAEKDEKYKAERTRLQSVLTALAQTEISTPRGNDDEDSNDEGDEESDDEYSQDEDRSKIIHNMATKLLKFSKTISEVQKSSEGKPVRKKKKVLHNLVSRYRSLVTKILANWAKLKGKKKSGIPRRKGVAKRGEIVRGKGNHTATAVHGNPIKTKANKTASIPKENETVQATTDGKTTYTKTTPVTSPSTKQNKKSKEEPKKKEKVAPILTKQATKKEEIAPDSSEEQDVLEIVHK